MRLLFSTIFLCLFSSTAIWAQDRPVPSDSVLQSEPIDHALKKTEDSLRNLHSPKKAAIRSAILPGLGQAYNKKYWKIPIVYAALGTTAGIFAYNLKYYRETRFAYQAKYKASLPAGQGQDSTDYFLIKPKYKNVSMNSLKYYRDEYRRDIDYSVLFFLLAWGLNVVDAAVDAHLMSFDVSPDLSFRIRAGRSQLGGTDGLSFVLAIK